MSLIDPAASSFLLEQGELDDMHLEFAQLVNALEQEKQAGNCNPGRLANRLLHMDLVILDLCAEVGYVE